MTTELSPSYAANLASNVYDVKSAITREDFVAEYCSDMKIQSSSMARGKTGLIIKKSHVMAVLAPGQGKYEGQAFVAIKGTASLYDALTDLNTGVQTCDSGCKVHQGFNYAFNSIKKELRDFISGLQRVSVIHCVGHSLGGAIATLAADWIRHSGNLATVKLYTFGSPRVGLDTFAQKCTSRVRGENIYRVYHQTDPVPMVPTWPFHHVPMRDADYLVHSPVAIKPWEYHLMDRYIASMEKAGSWDVIKRNRPKTYLDATVERWLQSDGIFSLTANTLALLDAALLYVIKKVLHAAGIVLVSAAAGYFTLMDRLAQLLAKAAKVSADVSIWVYHLVKKMARAIGITLKKGADLTTEFIRTVFHRLHRKISEMIFHAGQEVD